MFRRRHPQTDIGALGYFDGVPTQRLDPETQRFVDQTNPIFHADANRLTDTPESFLRGHTLRGEPGGALRIIQEQGAPHNMHYVFATTDGNLHWFSEEHNGLRGNNGRWTLNIRSYAPDPRGGWRATRRTIPREMMDHGLAIATDDVVGGQVRVFTTDVGYHGRGGVIELWGHHPEADEHSWHWERLSDRDKSSMFVVDEVLRAALSADGKEVGTLAVMSLLANPDGRAA